MLSSPANPSPAIKRGLSVSIGARLRALREQKQFSQGDMEKRTGLLRHYISRLENGHTVPEIDTLEKMARALGVPLYRLFYDANHVDPGPETHVSEVDSEASWNGSAKDARFLRQLCRELKSMSDDQRSLLLYIARKLAGMNRVGGLGKN